MPSATFVRGASRDQEIDGSCRALVGSLDLPPDVVARVREIIARFVTARGALPSQIPERQPAPVADGGTMIPGLWAQTTLMHAERDAAIRTLLTHPEHLRAFDANAAAEQRQLDAVRPSWAT
jgi:hypothetical protein